MTLNDIIRRMIYMNSKGYETYFKGKGNGEIQAIAEIWEIKNK